MVRDVLVISLISLFVLLLFNAVLMVIKEAVEMTRRGQMFWNVRWPFLSITDSID